jgi:hypothetical protein
MTAHPEVGPEPSESLRPLAPLRGRVFVFDCIAQMFGCAIDQQPLDLPGFERCENVLRSVLAWQQVCAMAAPARVVRQIPRKVLHPNNLQSDR